MQQLQSDGSYNELYPKTDAWTKDETLSAQVASVLGLRDNYKPDDAFLGLYFGAGTYRYRVRVLFEDGSPAQGCTVSGISQITGLSLVTDEQGYVLGKSTYHSVTISVFVPFLDQNKLDSQTVKSSGIITDCVFNLSKNSNLITITTSSTQYKISPFAKTVDIGYVRGGGHGTAERFSRSYGGAGAAGRYKIGYSVIGNESLSITIGAAQSDTGASQTSVKINNIDLSLDVFNEGFPATQGTGSTGFLLFAESSLRYYGSSGGGGGYERATPGAAAAYDGGCSGGIGAGNGRYAKVGWDSSSGNVTYEAGDGSSATHYGCGGGGAGFVSNYKETSSVVGAAGKGRPRAAFFRFHF